MQDLEIANAIALLDELIGIRQRRLDLILSNRLKGPPSTLMLAILVQERLEAMKDNRNALSQLHRARNLLEERRRRSQPLISD